jgi:hypothetical protein
MSSNGRMKQSRYNTIPTTNKKFETFIENLFESRESPEDIKDKIVKYVQALETSYTQVI